MIGKGAHLLRRAGLSLWALSILCAAGAFPAPAAPAGDAAGRTRVIMPGDRLRVSVAEQSDMDQVYTVAGDGTMDFGFVGRVPVAGKTTAEAGAELEQRLEQSYFKDATVTVEVAQYVEGAIMVMGAVQKPQAMAFRSDDMLTVSEAIIQCGGFNRDAAGTRVKILRWDVGGGMKRVVLTVDVQSMFETLDFSKDQFLRPRDIIMVPTLGASEPSPEYLALGEVGAPGFHPYSEGLDLIRALMRAGGPNRTAKLNAARLLRADKGGGYSPIPIDLSRLLGSADMRINIRILPGDILFLPSAEQASQGQVYLLGEVTHPGALPMPLDQEVTLARMILSSGGLGQFANDSKIRIIRQAPDGSRQTLTADVGKILKTGNFEEDIPLVSGDVIIVPEKVLGF